MSFMLTRGKIFICQKCGHRVQVEYEGGETMTQIGDFEVMRQTQIAEELCEQQTIEGSKGFYLYDFGLCGTCYEKDIDKAMKEKSRELNRLFPKLVSVTINSFKFSVKCYLKDINGRVVKSFPEKIFISNRMEEWSGIVPTEEFSEHMVLIPSLKIKYKGKEKIYEDGLHYIRIQATRNWDYKWVKQPLRDVLYPEKTEISFVSTPTNPIHNTDPICKQYF